MSKGGLQHRGDAGGKQAEPLHAHGTCAAQSGSRSGWKTQTSPSAKKRVSVATRGPLSMIQQPGASERHQVHLRRASQREACPEPRARMDGCKSDACPEQSWIQLWELLCWPLATALPGHEPAPATGAGESENKTNPVLLGEETRPLEMPGVSGQLWSFLWIIYPHAANQNKSIQLLLPF